MSPAVVPCLAIARGQPGDPAAPRAETLSPEQRRPPPPQLRPGSSVRPAGPGGGPAVFPMETPPTGKGRTGLVQCLGRVGARGAARFPAGRGVWKCPRFPTCRHHHPCLLSPAKRILQKAQIPQTVPNPSAKPHSCFRKMSAMTSDDGLLWVNARADSFPVPLDFWL